jgi:hypothetical protein
MLEALFEKARDGIAELGLKPFGWTRILPPSIWITLLVLVLVSGRLFWVNASRPAHRQEITDAFGSGCEFYGLPQINQDGSQITYVATDDHGYALFLCDTATGRQQIITEHRGRGELGNRLDLLAWPWSPDGRHYVYTERDVWSYTLLICPTGTNTAPVRLAAEPSTFVTNIVWLSPTALVWQEGEKFAYASKSEGGDWKITKLPHEGKIQNLTPIDDHTIAWIQEDYLCRLDLTQNQQDSVTPVQPPTMKTNVYAVPATTDLVLWLDASTLQQPDNTPVTSLADLSVKMNQAIPNLNPPSYNAPDGPNGLNGKGTIHFRKGPITIESGNVKTTATGLQTTRPLGIADSQPRSVFAVMRRTAANSMLISIGNLVTNGGGFGFCDQNNKLYLPFGGFGAKEVGRKSLPAAWRILEAIYDGENCDSYINGGSKVATTQPFNTVDKAVEIGLRSARNPANTTASEGDFAELLIYNRALSSDEQRQVEDYLTAKWFKVKPFSSQSPLVWCDPKLSGLTGFAYSKETGRFLLSRTENDQDSLWLVDTHESNPTGATRILQGSFLRDPQWTGTREFACFSGDLKHPELVLNDLSGREKDRLFEQADIKSFNVTPDQTKILFFGTVSNESSPGIWQYDLGSKVLRSVVSGSAHPSTYAHAVVPYRGSFKLPSGRTVNCTVYPPVPFDRHKKYPLILGATVYGEGIKTDGMRGWPKALATCGAFVVNVDRADWGGE